MTNAIQKMKDNLLNENHPLYEKIKKEKPIWWRLINSDRDLYVEIRKENIIDAYFRGGRVAQISLKNDNFVATAHPLYIKDKVSRDDPEYFKISKSKNKNGEDIIIHNVIYQDCLKLISNRGSLAKMKERIKKYYAIEDKGDIEKTSEKLIQGKLIVDNRNIYLDSEFAYKFLAKPRSRKTIRFDLVQIKDNKLFFVELKRFWDYRMRTSKGEPEILEQMQNYIDFIKENGIELCDYYKTLYKIKVKLGLPVPQVDDIERLSINLMPQLLIAIFYDASKHGENAKQDRINYINDKLKTINIVPQYIDDKLEHIPHTAI